MEEKESKKVSAAYVSWGTFKNALEKLSQGVPNRLDRTVFTGMAWALQNQLFTALRFLGLIDDKNRPTKDLEDLAVSDDAKQKDLLKQILKGRYAEIFALDLMKTTPGELSQKMGEAYNVNGDTREKAVRFFTSAAEHVGVTLSPLFESGKKANGGTTTSKPGPKKRRSAARTSTSTGTNTDSQQPGTSKTVNLVSGGTLTLSASLDLFSLNSTDRQFVFKLIDELETYQQASQKSKDDTSSPS